MTPLHDTFLVVLGLLTVVIGLMTLVAGALRDLTRAQRRSFGIGGLLFVFLGAALAIEHLGGVIGLGSGTRQVWFGVVSVLYVAAVLTAMVLTFVVGATGTAHRGAPSAERDALKGRPERLLAEWRGRRRQPEDQRAPSPTPQDPEKPPAEWRGRRPQPEERPASKLTPYDADGFDILTENAPVAAASRAEQDGSMPVTTGRIPRSR